MKSFWIHAFQVSVVAVAVAYLFLLAVLVWLVWRALCWIATRRQPQPETKTPAADGLEAAAIRHLGEHLHTHPGDAIDGELDRHLDQYAASIQALYPTGEQQ